jgi:hypothetical protein
MRLYGITREEIIECVENPAWHEVEPVDRGVYQHAWIDAFEKVWKRRFGNTSMFSTRMKRTTV